MKTKFNESIFYFDGDNSSFVEASHISEEGLFLPSDFTKKTRLREFQIEFSFPNSEFIVRVKATLENFDQALFLRFSEIDGKSLAKIQGFISEKSKSESKISNEASL